MKKIRVTLVASADPVRRQCSGPVAEHPSIEVVAVPSALSHPGTWRALARTDVVVIDEGVVRSEGFAAVRIMLDAYPGLHCLLITDEDRGKAMTWTLVQGLRGVMAQADIHLLDRAIRRIHAGEIWMPRALVEWLREPVHWHPRIGARGVPRSDWGRWH